MASWHQHDVRKAEAAIRAAVPDAEVFRFDYGFGLEVYRRTPDKKRVLILVTVFQPKRPGGQIEIVTPVDAVIARLKDAKENA